MRRRLQHPMWQRLQPYAPEPATVSTGRRVLLGSEDKATFSAARLYIDIRSICIHIIDV